MVLEGDTAPDFELPGVAAGAKSRYRLSEATGRGKYVLLIFYPADFSPVCTAEMCAIRDSEFFTFETDVEVWGVSGDSVYSHRAFGDQHDLTFPLLSDTERVVAEEYDNRYDEWEGQRLMTKRAVFLVDPNRKVRYFWQSDDAYAEPDLWPIKEAIETAKRQGLDTDASTDDLSEPGEEPYVEPLE